jgi:hypothetical protein
VPGTRFVNCIDRDRPPREWTPPVRIEEHIDTWYFGPALEAMDRELAVDGLTVYLTFDRRALPTYGDDVVVVLLGDESAVVPEYVDRVRAIFRNHSGRPALGCNPLAWPSVATFAAVLSAARVAWRSAPSRAALARAQLSAARGRGRPPAPQIELPLGAYNALDLDPKPMPERRWDMFFAGSLVQDPAPSARLKARVLPKSLSRDAMLRNVERLVRDSKATAEVRLTEGFPQSAASDPEDYSRALMDARLALAPRGATPETFRFFQALKYGCIIVTDAIPPIWFYERAPMVRLRHWDELEDAVLPLLADPGRLEALHRQSLAWWDAACSEAAVGRFMAHTLNSLG